MSPTRQTPSIQQSTYIIAAIALLFLLLTTGCLVTQIAKAQSPQSPQSPQSHMNALSPQWIEGAPTDGGTPTPTCVSDWKQVTTQNPGTYTNSLNGVFARSMDDVWAVGYTAGSGGLLQTMVQHWDGNQWNLTPAFTGIGRSLLNAVAATSANDAWAVGYYFTSTINQLYSQTLIERWDGTQWTQVPSPSAGIGHNQLTSISIVSANDIWAAGQFGNDYVRFQPLTLHWDGASWNIVSSPTPDPRENCYVTGITAIAPNDVWAVGYFLTAARFHTLTLHWDGTQWTIVPSPNDPIGYNYLTSVAAVSANDIWAVGYVDEGFIFTLALHWDGSQWSHISSPNPNSDVNRLSSVTVVSTNEVWAVGYTETSFQNQRTLIEKWNGADWSAVPSPNVQPSNFLNGVGASSSSQIWAVGYYSGVSAPDTLALHYPGFTDLPPDSAFYPYVHCLVCRGIINGYDDGTFRPNTNVTRGQLAKIVSNAANFQDPPIGQTFEDVPPSSTFYTYTERLASRSVMNGYPCGQDPNELCNPPTNRPYFRPGNNATRGQISKIVSQAANFQEPPVGQIFEDVPPGSPFYTYTQRLASRTIMNGYPCGNPELCVPPGNRPYFRPGNDATRGQTSKIVSNTFFPDCNPPVKR